MPTAPQRYALTSETEINPSDPLNSQAVEWIAWTPAHPELVDRLTERLIDSGEGAWGLHNATAKHRTLTRAVVANPVVADELRADLVRIQVATEDELGDDSTSHLAAAAHQVRDVLGPASIEELSQSPDGGVLRVLARRADLTDDQVARLFDRPRARHNRAPAQAEVARNTDGTFAPRVVVAMRSELDRRDAEIRW